jgi:hypothetical protein
MACGGASRAARDSFDLHDEPGSALRKSGVVPGFRLRLRGIRRFVAWIERSEIWERRFGSIAAPGFRFAQPRLRRRRRRKRNAGKRWVATAASCDAARAFLERARLTAFHHGSHPREYLIPKAQLQARLPGTWSARALPAFACPSPGMHLPSRSYCREADTQAARERTANPPAGTALAPTTRCASAPCPSKERGLCSN